MLWNPKQRSNPAVHLPSLTLFILWLNVVHIFKNVLLIWHFQNENPGPGKYTSHKSMNNNSTSFSKRGTGGFASKVRLGKGSCFTCKTRVTLWHRLMGMDQQIDMRVIKIYPKGEIYKLVGMHFEWLAQYSHFITWFSVAAVCAFKYMCILSFNWGAFKWLGDLNDVFR